MHGAETELDRQVLDLIKDPLTHMVRNSADHGLETPARAARRRQAREGHDPPLRLSRGRPHHHRDRRRRPRPRHRADQGARRSPAGSRPRPSSTRCPRRRSRSSSSRPASRPPQASPACPAAASAWTSCATNIDQIGGTIDVQSVRGQRHELHHQDPADARDRLGADRRVRRRALRHPAARRGRAGARARPIPSIASSASRTRRCCACATSCCRSSASQTLLEARRRRAATRRTASSS